jgi:hypothetical protein
VQVERKEIARVYSMSGALVLEREVAAGSAALSLAGLRPGVYLLCVDHRSAKFVVAER